MASEEDSSLEDNSGSENNSTLEDNSGSEDNSSLEDNPETASEAKVSAENEKWTAAINRILKTDVPRKKSVVLALAEKESANEETEVAEKGYDFEIDGGDSDVEIKEEKPDVKDLDLKLKPGAKRLMKKEHEKTGHAKPDILEKNYERTLMKIATKGVVQLFNAVKQQQKDIEKMVKSNKRKVIDEKDIAESIDRKKFLSNLSQKAKSIPVSMPESIKIKEEEVEPSWSVLRDDFLMNSSVKSWDS